MISPVQRLLTLVHRPDLGLLALRSIVGVVGVYHGGQKLFGAFGGPGIDGFAGWLQSLGVPMPQFSAVLAGSSEFFGGILIAIGLGTRLAALPFLFSMFIAVTMVHSKAFDARNNGMEYPLTLAVVLASLFLTGPGRFSIDAILKAKARA